MCMGKLYANWGLGDLVLVHSKDISIQTFERATEVALMYSGLWEQMYDAQWSGDFYLMLNDDMYVYTEGPPEVGSPVKWERLVYGTAGLDEPPAPETIVLEVTVEFDGNKAYHQEVVEAIAHQLETAKIPAITEDMGIQVKKVEVKP